MEAGCITHFRYRGSTNEKMDEHSEGFAIDPMVPPRGCTVGFVFSNLKRGTKEVRVRLFGPEQVKDFEFYVTVPCLHADWQRVDIYSLHSVDDVIDIEDERELERPSPAWV